MWKEYEEDIYNILIKNYPECNIEYNDSIFGIYSRCERQIDIAIRGNMGGNKILGIIDTKFYGKKLDVKDVESIIGMMQDVNANFGLIITNKGYSKSAKSRAIFSNLKLDILNYDEFGKINLTVDYFINKNIIGLQLSKFEFFQRNEQNTGYFDRNKSDYKKRIIVYKEGYAETEFYAQKKLLENCTRAFRDFNQLKEITIYIPANINNDSTNFENIKHVFRCHINRYNLEIFLKNEINDWRDDITIWREYFLKSINITTVNNFSKNHISHFAYENYEKLILP